MKVFSEKPEKADRPERVARFEEPSGDAAEAPKKSPLAWLLLSAPRFLGSRFALLILGMAALGLMTFFALTADSLFRGNELEREKEKLEAEIELYKDENRLLRMQIERSTSDSAYIEDEARKKLGLVRPGETVYRLSEEPDLSEDRPQEPPVIP